MILRSINFPSCRKKSFFERRYRETACWGQLQRFLFDEGKTDDPFAAGGQPGCWLVELGGVHLRVGLGLVVSMGPKHPRQVRCDCVAQSSPHPGWLPVPTWREWGVRRLVLLLTQVGVALFCFLLVVSHFGQGAIRRHAAGQGAIRQGVPSWHQRWACSQKDKDRCLVLVWDHHSAIVARLGQWCNHSLFWPLRYQRWEVLRKLARQKLRGDRSRMFGTPTFSHVAACSPDAVFTPGREASQLLGQGMGRGRCFLGGPPFRLRVQLRFFFCGHSATTRKPLHFGLQSSSLAKHLLHQQTFGQGLQQGGPCHRNHASLRCNPS